MKRVLATTAILAALTCPGAASTVTLGGVTWDTTNSGSLSLGNVVPAGNQPQNAPCVICGANQPQQPANFGYNDYSNNGSVSSITAFSDQGNGGRNTLADNTFATGYTVGAGSPFLAFLLLNGDTSLGFSIGVDVNDTNSPQTLNSFFFLDFTTHTVLASFTGGTTGNVPSKNNGTGFPDYSITGALLNLNDVHVGDTIGFVALMSGLNDGPDSFFIEAAPAAVVTPLPASLPFFAAGLLGLAGLTRSLRRQCRGDATASA
jgi:hypothetical protein